MAHCEVTAEAPFNGEATTHQCSGTNAHPTPSNDKGQPLLAYFHYCGCGYEWGDSGLIIKIPKGEK